MNELEKLKKEISKPRKGERYGKKELIAKLYFEEENKQKHGGKE